MQFYLTSKGVLATTNRQTLTLGDTVAGGDINLVFEDQIILQG